MLFIKLVVASIYFVSNSVILHKNAGLHSINRCRHMLDIIKKQKAWVHNPSLYPLDDKTNNLGLRSDGSHFHKKRVKELNANHVKSTTVEDTAKNALKHLSSIQPRNSIIGVACILTIYLICSILYNQRRKMLEKERIHKAMDQYEKDKNEYIETGITRP